MPERRQPEPPRLQRRIGQIALVAGVIQPLITLPQIITIYANRSAADVSLITWVGYLVFGVTFLVYGLAYGLRPIWIGQTVWVAMQTIMVIGILLYR